VQGCRETRKASVTKRPVRSGDAAQPIAGVLYQQAVPRGPFRALCCGSLKHADLVAQSQVLELESGTRTEDRGH
jgi:hypothetical protein